MKHYLTDKQFREEYRTPSVLNDGTRQQVTRDEQGRLAVAPETEVIASYLNKRLYEIGVRQVFAIPGDYIAEWVETLDDATLNPPATRITRQHPNNEMCAGYAADGYGRSGSNRVGCFAVTYGVGALNAVNSVAGAFVEDVPVVMINGTPSKAQFNSQRDQGILWHHMFDGSGTDRKVLEQVTAMAVTIDNPATAPALIDAALLTCITESKPVYIEIAVGTELMPCAPVPATPLVPVPPPYDDKAMLNAVDTVLERLTKSEKLVVVGGMELARAGIQDEFRALIQALDAPFVSSLLGKSVLDEFDDSIRFSGVFNGRNSQQNVLDLLSQADCILALGVDGTDFNFSGMVNANQPTSVEIPQLITASRGALRIEDCNCPGQEFYWGDIQLPVLVSDLKDRVGDNWQPPAGSYPGLAGSPWEIPVVDPVAGAGDPLGWDNFKSLLHHDFMQQGDVLLADTGLTFYNLQNVKVAQNGYIAQLSWGAIGYSVAANYGVALANQDASQGGQTGRTITVSGDGAFSETVNALGTMAQLNTRSVVFVMNNKVFAIEQWLVNPCVFGEEPDPADPDKNFLPLTRVPQGHIWDYEQLAQGFGGKGYKVSTVGELHTALQEINADFAEQTAKGGDAPALPRFYLVSVEIPAYDLPSNTRWKLDEANCQSKNV